jgi:prepilin-type N-terminal cleavage/methylation domain-containing protein
MAVHAGSRLKRERFTRFMRMQFTKKNSGRTAESAFSLLEVLVAAVVVAIIYASLFAGISTTFSMLQTVRENLRATQIMVSRMEGLRLCAWSNSQLFNTNVVPSAFTDTFYPIGLNSTTNCGTVYSGTMTIMQNPGLSPNASYAANMALVTITVTWTNGANGVVNIHRRSMSTYVAKYGLQNYVYSN